MPLGTKWGATMPTECAMLQTSLEGRRGRGTPDDARGRLEVEDERLEADAPPVVRGAPRRAPAAERLLDERRVREVGHAVEEHGDPVGPVRAQDAGHEVRVQKVRGRVEHVLAVLVARHQIGRPRLVARAGGVRFEGHAPQERGRVRHERGRVPSGRLLAGPRERAGPERVITRVPAGLLSRARAARDLGEVDDQILSDAKVAELAVVLEAAGVAHERRVAAVAIGRRRRPVALDEPGPPLGLAVALEARERERARGRRRRGGRGLAARRRGAGAVDVLARRGERGVGVLHRELRRRERVGGLPRRRAKNRRLAGECPMAPVKRPEGVGNHAGREPGGPGAFGLLRRHLGDRRVPGPLGKAIFVARTPSSTGASRACETPLSLPSPAVPPGPLAWSRLLLARA